MKLEDTFKTPRKFKVVKVPVDENEYTEKLSEDHGVNYLKASSYSSSLNFLINNRSAVFPIWQFTRAEKKSKVFL